MAYVDGQVEVGEEGLLLRQLLWILAQLLVYSITTEVDFNSYEMKGQQYIYHPKWRM